MLLCPRYDLILKRSNPELRRCCAALARKSCVWIPCSYPFFFKHLLILLSNPLANASTYYSLVAEGGKANTIASLHSTCRNCLPRLYVLSDIYTVRALLFPGGKLIGYIWFDHCGTASAGISFQRIMFLSKNSIHKSATS